MIDNESVSKRLRRESEELRRAAVDLMEHASLLIEKSMQIDNEIAKHDKVGKR